MAKLNDEQKAFLVRQLAAGHAPSAVARAVREAFGISLTKQSVQYYHPERFASRHLARRWKRLFGEVRGAMNTPATGDLDASAAGANAHQPARQAWAAKL